MSVIYRPGVGLRQLWASVTTVKNLLLLLTSLELAAKFGHQIGCRAASLFP